VKAYPRFRISMPLEEIPGFFAPCSPRAVEKFAAAFRAYGGFLRVFPVGSGRAGFRLILGALELEPGDEIVFPAYTFHPMPVLAAELGYKPVFADVDPGTWNLDPESFRSRITPRTRAVVPTHLFGVPARMTEIVRIAREHKIAVIEDCAHAFGAVSSGRPAGSFGDAAFFTFAPSKNLPCWGGGMVTTAREDLAEKMAKLSPLLRPASWGEIFRAQLGNMAAMLAVHPTFYSWTLHPLVNLAARRGSDMFERKFLEEVVPPREVSNPLSVISYQAPGGGMAPVQAAAGLRQLRRFPLWLKRQSENARCLREALRDIPGFEFQAEPEGAESSFLYLRVRVEEPEKVRRRLLAAGVDTKADDMRNCSSLPFFRPGPDCPAAARLGGHCLELPCSPFYSKEDMDDIALRVRRVREF